MMVDGEEDGSVKAGQYAGVIHSCLGKHRN